MQVTFIIYIEINYVTPPLQIVISLLNLYVQFNWENVLNYFQFLMHTDYLHNFDIFINRNVIKFR